MGEHDLAALNLDQLRKLKLRVDAEFKRRIQLRGAGEDWLDHQLRIAREEVSVLPEWQRREFENEIERRLEPPHARRE